jgi:hypothetical protein
VQAREVKSGALEEQWSKEGNSVSKKTLASDETLAGKKADSIEEAHS